MTLTLCSMTTNGDFGIEVSEATCIDPTIIVVNQCLLLNKNQNLAYRLFALLQNQLAPT